MTQYKPPFPWFGGKATVAHLVWQALGDVPNYVEPFFGSGAVLFLRPHAPQIETVNDKDGFVSNFWRAIQAEPDAVAHYADWPVNENDLHARHAWLVGHRDDLTRMLEGDPAFYDVQIAGWWVWGLCCWIGSGFCSGTGRWQVRDGRLVPGDGVAGKGIHRQLVHLGNAGQGVNRQRVHLGNAGQGVNRQRVDLRTYLTELAARLRNVRVCSGDWTRVVGPSPTVRMGITGVFLDPPYSHAERNNDLYGIEEDISADVRAWAVAHGEDSRYRIVLAGYAGEHAMPGTWQEITWKAHGGYGSQGDGRGRSNANRERLWCSPHCQPLRQQLELFNAVQT